MSDNLDDNDMNFAEGESGAEAAAPKAKGLGGGILKILMIVGIALGAVILMVTVVIVTVSIMNRQGKPLSAVPASEAYQAATPVYQYVTTIGEIRTRTRDAEPASVLIKINLGFSKDDKESPTEVTERLYQIRDYLRNFFSMKYARDLQPEVEEVLKEELRENLNRILSKPTIKEVLFEKFDVIQL